MRPRIDDARRSVSRYLTLALLLCACSELESDADPRASPEPRSAHSEERSIPDRDAADGPFSRGDAIPDLRTIVGMTEEEATAAFAARGVALRTSDFQSSPARELEADLPPSSTRVWMRVTPAPRRVFRLAFEVRYADEQEGDRIRAQIERDYGPAIRDETFERRATEDSVRSHHRRTIHRGPPCARVSQAYDHRAFMIVLGSNPVRYSADGRALELRSLCDEGA